MENNIIDVSICLGEILHEYHIRFGEEKYNTFINRLGNNLENIYGKNYSMEKLSLMEKEYSEMSACHAKVKLKS